MEQLAAILLLLGCSDDAHSCTELPAPSEGYETGQACEAEMPRAMRAAGRNYPLILAKCVAIDPATQGEMEIVWDVNERGELLAAIVPYRNDEVTEETLVAGLRAADKGPRLR